MKKGERRKGRRRRGKRREGKVKGAIAFSCYGNQLASMYGIPML